MALNGSGAKARIVRVRRERDVQFARALAEQLRFLRINAADQFLEHRARRRRLHFADRALRAEHALVITANRIERQRPGVAFVRHGASAAGRRPSARVFVPAIFQRHRETPAHVETCSAQSEIA